MSYDSLAFSLAGIALLAIVIFVIIRVAQGPNSDWTDSSAAKMALIITLIATTLACTVTFFFSRHGADKIQISINNKATSVLGACLSAIGILGEKRLIEWDHKVHEWLRKRSFSLLWADTSHESILALFFNSRLKWLFITLLVFMIVTAPFSSPYQEEPNIGFLIFYGSCITLPSILILVPFGPYTLVPLFWIMLLPYRIIRLIEKEKSLERTLLFLGLVLTTAGILLQE